MKFFERGPKPQSNLNAERNLDAALAEQDQQSRELRYLQLRNEQLTPLMREEARLEIALELESTKLRGARLRESDADEELTHHRELEKIRKQRADLKGEPFSPQPAPVGHAGSAASDAAYQAVKSQLDAVRAEIRDRSAEFRADLHLPPL